MARPSLLFASPNGQSSLRCFFSESMRELGAGHPADPENPTLWTAPVAVERVTRNSPVEFELHLAASLPLAPGYNVSIAETAESSAGEPMDPAGVAVTFDVVTADLTVLGATWPDAQTVVVSFSEAITTDFVDGDVFVRPVDGGRAIGVASVTAVGPMLTVTWDEAGTMGARYELVLPPEKVVATVSLVSLNHTGVVPCFGQGNPPRVASAAQIGDTVVVVFDEEIGEEGPPLPAGVYTTDNGSLGTETTRAETSVTFTDPSIDGAATVGLRTLVNRQVAGQTWTGLAEVSGPVTETVGVGETTWTKAVGALGEVGEVVLTPRGSLSGAGRIMFTRILVNMITAPVGSPVFGMMLPSTTTTVMFHRSGPTTMQARLYRGENVIRSSADFDVSLPFDLTLTDATSEVAGHLALAIEGLVVLGATRDEVRDEALIHRNVSPVGIVLFFGDPASAFAMSVTFQEDLAVQSFVSNGLLGGSSRDLLSFDHLSAPVNVVVDDHGGFQGTGKGAFGVFAEYIDFSGDYAIDAIQVVVALNEDATIPTFTGTCVLLTPSGEPFDTVGFDQTHMTTEREVVLVFQHPKVCTGVSAAVTVTIAEVDYTVVVPANPSSLGQGYAPMAVQPASWWRPRVHPQGVTSMAPADITQHE